MEKLFNWTIGSFFRTIGRIIAYFAIGAIIAYILSNSNIKLPRITNLFFTKVKASEVTFTQLTTNDITSWDAFGNTNPGNIYRQNRNWYYYITMKVDNRLPIQTNSNRVYFSINNKGYVTNMEYAYFTIYTYLGFATSQSTGLERYNLRPLMFLGNNPCEIYNYTESNADNTNLIYSEIQYKCPVSNGGITFIYDGLLSSYFVAEIGIKEIIAFTQGAIGNNEIQAIIDNQDQNTQEIIDNQNQIHNETMTIITDTNTTQEQNETTSFFESFEFSSDNSGLLGVITAPLRVINSIVNGQFSDLCFTLKSKNVCFPNGNMIWQKSNRDSTWFGSGSISSGIQAFVSLFNLVAGGYILYKMGVSIKRLTEDLINPTNTRIEVMKL